MTRYSGMPVSRKRSCASCRTAKTRCSLIFPICTRCRSRRLKCEYAQAPESSSGPSDSWLGDGSSFNATDEPSNVPSGPEALQTVFSIREESRNSDFNGETVLDWNPEDAGQDGSASGGGFSSILEVAPTDTSAIGASFQASETQMQSLQNSALEPDILRGSMRDNLSELQESSTCAVTDWPAPTELPKSHPNLLNPREWKAVGPFLASKYVLGVFHSYPRMLCDKTTPPFIHPRYPGNNHVCASDKAPELPECLAICASLVHMHQSRTKASIAYIWKTIAAEQARLYGEFAGYDKWQLLSALQAITIYLTLQAGEEEHDSEISFMLVVAMGEMAAKLFAENGYYCLSELSGNFPDWDDWVFAESCRRTMLLLFIMEKLLNVNIDVTPPAACTGFDSVPLPCSEALWKADTRASWEASYKQYLAGRKGSGLLKYGTLRQSQQLETRALDQACLQDLETWCTGVDGFGLVVMMVARGI